MITKAVEYLVNQLIENELIEEVQRDEYLYSLECFIVGVEQNSYRWPPLCMGILHQPKRPKTRCNTVK